MPIESLRIRDVASSAGVSVDTIRHYEAKGLLGEIPRDANGYRRYGAATIDRVHVVRRALAIGFTLDELARIFRQRAEGTAPCRGVRDLAARKLAEVDEQIEAMQGLRATLARILESWDGQLEKKPEGGFARLLESLIE